MGLRLHIRLVWVGIVLLGLVAGVALTQERTAGPDKAVTVERNLAQRFDAGRKWAVIVGVAKYLDAQIPSLRYCVDDARLLEKTLA